MCCNVCFCVRQQWICKRGHWSINMSHVYKWQCCIVEEVRDGNQLSVRSYLSETPICIHIQPRHCIRSSWSVLHYLCHTGGTQKERSHLNFHLQHGQDFRVWKLSETYQSDKEEVLHLTHYTVLHSLFILWNTFCLNNLFNHMFHCFPAQHIAKGSVIIPYIFRNGCFIVCLFTSMCYELSVLKPPAASG